MCDGPPTTAVASGSGLNEERFNSVAVTPHRDNTTKGTAHRRFAVTLNLNSEDYDGGYLRFLEYGPQLFKAPTGGAVVFSCSMLHKALPVTSGTRYVFLPFLYDEAAAVIRKDNNAFLSENLGAYKKA